MRYWNALRDASGFSNIYTTTDSKTGQRVVGVDIPADQISPLIARIEGGASTVNARQLMLDVLANNTKYTLEGGIQVRRARIAKESVIQMVPQNQDVARNLQNLGLMFERQMTGPIYYVPDSDKTPTTFDIVNRVLAQYPVQPEQPVQQSREVPGFYSAMERVAEAKLPNRALPEHILGVLKNPQSGVKAEELKWSGIETWLADKKGPVSKQDVLDMIAGQFTFPAHFGKNFDALYDCMTDLVHKAGTQPGFVVVLEQLPDNPRFDREAREQLLDVFRDAADFWAERRIAFRCFYSFAVPRGADATAWERGHDGHVAADKPAPKSVSKNGANPNFGMNMPLMSSAFDTAMWMNAA
jgi:RNAse (barnase) inhibitor barstar